MVCSLVSARILFANWLTNVSDDNLLREPYLPLVQILAYATFALCILGMLSLLLQRKREHKKVVPDSWEPVALPDVVVQLFMGLAMFDLFTVLLAVVLMVLPSLGHHHLHMITPIMYTSTRACIQPRRAPSPPRYCESTLPSLVSTRPC